MMMKVFNFAIILCIFHVAHLITPCAVATVSMVTSDVTVAEGDGSVSVAVVISGPADGLECDVVANLSLIGSRKAGITLVLCNMSYLSMQL